MKLPRLASFRTRLLLVVLVVAVLPLLLVGGWLTQSVSRSGEELLRRRLEMAVNDAALRIGQRWLAEQSVLLDLAESAAMRGALAEPKPAAELQELAAEAAQRSVQLVALRDTAQREVVRFAANRSAGGNIAAATIPMALPVHAAPLAARIGTLEARLPLGAIVSAATPAPGAVGNALGVYESDTRVPLVPLPFELPSRLRTSISWGGEVWLLATRELSTPRLLLVTAAPISPFAQPFRAAARDGMALLAITGVIGFLIAALLTTRMTRSLQRLATAADAVATGALDLKVEESGQDEVGRVGRAFNNMTGSLRRTLQELADHKALAATGEFAASLAHEIRNPLSAVRVDLQVVEEELPADSELRRVQRRALSEISRLDATLSGALQSARAGRQLRAAVPIVEPLLAAIATAQSSAGPGVVLRIADDLPQYNVIGDAAALQQLFLNLLLNAIQAAKASVAVQVQSVGEDVAITIVDDGPGIPGDRRERVFDPLFTTRPGGTGLGLTIAQRIAGAHGGSIELAPAETGGTVAHVLLPMA